MGSGSAVFSKGIRDQALQGNNKSHEMLEMRLLQGFVKLLLLFLDCMVYYLDSSLACEQVLGLRGGGWGRASFLLHLLQPLTRELAL